MTFKTSIFSTLLFILSLPIVEAQNSSIEGIVLDKKTKTPIPFASVALYALPDSNLIGGNVTDERGQYKVNKIKPNAYIIKASYIGYESTYHPETIRIKSGEKVRLKPIMMAQSQDALDEVVIEGDTEPLVKFEGGKKIIAVDKDISATGGNAVDALRNAPSITVDIDDNVQLRGRTDFLVLIDGKETILKGSEALRQIPAGNIERIEVITNPSAKYDMTNAAGIINIILKKNKLEGISGQVEGSIGTFDYYRTNLNLNYNTKKLTLVASGTWNTSAREANINTQTNTYRDSAFTNTDLKQYSDRKRYNAKLGAEYRINKAQDISLSAAVGENNNAWDPFSNKSRIYSNGLPSEYSHAKTTNKYNSNFINLNFTYRLFLDTLRQKLELQGYSGQTTNDDYKLQQTFNTDDNFNPQGAPLNTVLNTKDRNYREERLKLNYSKPINKTTRLEAGVHSWFQHADEKYLTEVADNTTAPPSSNRRRNTLDFDRITMAAFSTYASKFKKLSYQVRVRAELTNSTAKLSTQSHTNHVNQLDVFPTASLSYGLEKGYKLQGSYSKRVRRQDPWELSGDTFLLDNEILFVNNPELRPSKTDVFEFGLVKEFKRQYVSLESFYRVTNDYTDRYLFYDNGFFYNQTHNIGQRKNLGLELSGFFKPKKWLEISPYLSVYYQDIKGRVFENVIDRQGTTFNGRCNFIFKPFETLRIQYNFSYNGPRVEANGSRDGMVFTNISVKKSFLEKKLSATVRMRNPSNLFEYRSNPSGPDFDSKVFYQPAYPSIRITISYNFNNFRKKGGSMINPVGGEGGSDFQ